MSATFPLRREANSMDDLRYWYRSADADLGNALLRKAAHHYQQCGALSFDNLVEAGEDAKHYSETSEYLSKEQIHLLRVAACIARMASAFFRRFGPSGMDGAN